MTRFALPAFLLSMVLWGCDSAPYENPLDERSPAFRDAGSVEGRATGVYSPFAGRPGVRVRLIPVGGGPERVTTTGQAGGFELTDVPSGTYLVRAEADGLQAEETEVVVTASTTSLVDLRLNAQPIALSAQARTAHLAQTFPESTVYTLMVEATVTDPDRPSDVDAVAIVAESVGFRAPLVQTSPGTPSSPARYQATFDESVLPGGRIQSLLGQTLSIEVTDVFGAVSRGLTFSIARVIEETPLLLSPQGSVVLDTRTPTLDWREVLLPFPFVFTVEVSLLDASGVPNLVVAADSIPPFATSYTLERPLAPGDYVWTLRITDTEGNTSRSRRAGFRVSTDAS